jgi:Zn-finger nucleic acid-binding protein
VEIDYCQQCRGVWLDRGELDKIIDRAAVATPAPTREDSRVPDDRYRDDRPERRDDRYRDDRYDPRYDKKRKRRSFLEDIFDFD